jgi:phosphoribosyl 1,2-cyclic phosphate phosphodiesterase
LEEVLNLVKFLKPKKTILTNLNNDIDYKKIKKNLPNNVIPAYDGMSLSI